jgi:hypothetical protein
VQKRNDDAQPTSTLDSLDDSTMTFAINRAEVQGNVDRERRETKRR